MITLHFAISKENIFAAYNVSIIIFGQTNPAIINLHCGLDFLYRKEHKEQLYFLLFLTIS